MAITILAVGMLALAGLVSSTSGSTDRSRYMSLAGVQTSEKLEELSRLPPSDPSVAIPTGDSAGSLTSNVGPVTVAGNSVVYYDEVLLSSGAGNITETISKPNSTTGVPGYLTQTQTPDAGTQSTWSATAPAGSADTLRFERRWLIEDSTLTGLPAGTRRITVQVTLLNSPEQPKVVFQMSTVRQ